MDFFKISKRFKDDEDGAVTVDWVVLTGALVGIAIAVVTSVRNASIGLGGFISTEIDKQLP